MAEDEKELYDEEDPEVPVDLFGMWGTSSVTDDDEELIEENGTDEPTESAEPIIDAMPAEEPFAPAGASGLAADAGEVAADETTSANATDFGADTTAVAADETAPADATEFAADATEPTEAPAEPAAEAIALTDEPFDFAEPPAENTAPADASDFAPETTESSDITDDDLDDLIDVPILPLPVESTEVTADDLDDIRAPILSPGDPITIPHLTVQSDPDEQPVELSSPSLVEMVQEQDATEALGGDLTATNGDDPLALFKKLRDLAEELPHNVYAAFKASKMSATLDEIIAGLED